jgi:hypothetical protein
MDPRTRRAFGAIELIYQLNQGDFQQYLPSRWIFSFSSSPFPFTPSLSSLRNAGKIKKATGKRMPPFGGGLAVLITLLLCILFDFYFWKNTFCFLSSLFCVSSDKTEVTIHEILFCMGFIESLQRTGVVIVRCFNAWSVKGYKRDCSNSSLDL